MTIKLRYPVLAILAVLIGTVLNHLAVGLNGGRMPVPSVEVGVHLTFLCDVIPLLWWWVSLGDVLQVFGVAGYFACLVVTIVVAACRHIALLGQVKVAW